MLSKFQDFAARSADVALLVGRLLLAWIFIHEGVDLSANFAAYSTGMAKLGVPMPLLVATIALQLGAGSAVALGLLTRYGAAALALFCLATATMFHTNFASRNELLHFEKDIAIAGGFLVLMIHGAGVWSVDALLRRRTSPGSAVWIG